MGASIFETFSITPAQSCLALWHTWEVIHALLTQLIVMSLSSAASSLVLAPGNCTEPTVTLDNGYVNINVHIYRTVMLAWKLAVCIFTVTDEELLNLLYIVGQQIRRSENQRDQQIRWEVCFQIDRGRSGLMKVTWMVVKDFKKPFHKHFIAK